MQRASEFTSCPSSGDWTTTMRNSFHGRVGFSAETMSNADPVLVPPGLLRATTEFHIIRIPGHKIPGRNQQWKETDRSLLPLISSDVAERDRDINMLMSKENDISIGRLTHVRPHHPRRSARIRKLACWLPLSPVYDCRAHGRAGHNFRVAEYTTSAL